MGAALLACTSLTPAKFRCSCAEEGTWFPDSVSRTLPWAPTPLPHSQGIMLRSLCCKVSTFSFFLPTSSPANSSFRSPLGACSGNARPF